MPHALAIDSGFILQTLLVGASAGVLSAFFGIGGGFLIVPFLLAAGMSGSRAVGTSFIFLFATSAVAMLQHRRRGTFEPRVGLLAGLALLPGVEAGRRIILVLANRGESDLFVQGLTLLFLAFLAFRMLHAPARTGSAAAEGTPPPATGRPLRLVAGAAGTGLLSGLLGVGGGLLLVPLLIRHPGLPHARAVAASLFAILLGGLAGAVGYAGAGQTDWGPALLLLAAALPATRLGARAVHRVSGHRFRRLFLLLVGLTLIIVALRLAGITRGLAPALTAVAVVLAGWVARQGFRPDPEP